MRILHTEASPGWGGQEIRILEEAKGMRERGHEIIFVIQKQGGLVLPAQREGFLVYEIDFKKKRVFGIFFFLLKILRKHRIELVNTHSSLDSWLGGIAARTLGCPIIRTRHLSTAIKKGLNSFLLYKGLADVVVTTCQEVAETLKKQARQTHCLSIPTGVNPQKILVDQEKVKQWRTQWQLEAKDCVVGTLCVIRSWKGISDLLHAAKELEHSEHLKWVVIGGGVSEEHFRKQCQALGLEKKVLFTGHLDRPYEALAALDIFLLLSTAHEGVSQASLQAALLKKPLITTRTGGLKEICFHEETGLLVNTHAPKEVAEAVLYLSQKEELRRIMGQKAYHIAMEQFTFEKMLDDMETVYNRLHQKEKPF